MTAIPINTIAPIRRCTVLTLAATVLSVTPGWAQWPPDSFTNLKVLPKDIGQRELVSMMAGFTRALGVRCQFCHVGEEGLPLAEFDFPSDEKPTKLKAREMLRMVQAINSQHLANLEERSDPPVEVRCAICHRGVRQPRMIQDILVQAYQEGGLEPAVQKYRELWDRYYGRAAYDFGPVTLTEVAQRLEAMGQLSDAVQILALNLEHNPTDTFAQRMHAGRSIELTIIQQGTDAGIARYNSLQQEYGGRPSPNSC